MAIRILKYTAYGIAWGLGWFVITCLIFDLAAPAPIRAVVFDHFSQNAFASAITGIGFGTSSIVYTFERLRRWQQALIHFGVGMGIFFPVAFGFKWFPSTSAPIVISCVVTAVLVFALIWSCFYLYNSVEAEKINARLKSRENDERHGDG